MSNGDEFDRPIPVEQRLAEARISASALLLQAARDGDWAAGFWLLERHDWRAWGPWHPKCAPNAFPATPIQIRTPAARRAAQFLERSAPDDWGRRCRYCASRV